MAIDTSLVYPALSPFDWTTTGGTTSSGSLGRKTADAYMQISCYEAGARAAPLSFFEGLKQEIDLWHGKILGN